MSKQIIIEELKNSGFVLADPSPQNYNSPLFGALGVPLVGVSSPLKQPPIILPTGKGWRKVVEDYGEPEIQFNENFVKY